MKRFSEQLHKKSESISLRVDEKHVLRERLVSYMEYHPLPIDKKAPKTTFDQTLSDPVVRVISLNNLKFWQWSGATMAVLLLIVPYVAEKAVPGDMLYAVKVNFNEEVRSTLALSPYDKVVWETERLNRRIAEARLLVSEGKMTEELGNSVAEAVMTHSENAKKEIEHLKQTDEDGAVLASIQFDTTIDVQSTALMSNVQSSSTEGVMAVRLVDALAKTQESDQNLGNVLPSRERLVGQVEFETTRAYELLDSIKTYATQDEQLDIKRRLEDIGRKTEIALTTFESSEAEAGQQMLGILEDTQKLIVFMTNIDVRSSVTVEEIVPVTLTEEERLAAVNRQIEEINQLILETEVALQATSSAEIEEKVNLTLANSKSELQDEIMPSLNSGTFDLSQIEIKVREILNKVRDVQSLTGIGSEDVTHLIEENDLTTSTSTDKVEIPTPTATSTATSTQAEVR